MLYRFRNCKSLLDHNELQDEYFWFSKVSELNDPSEGFINFYWQGDYIAWLGLFKNYVWQLYEYIIQAPIFIDGDNIDALNKLFFLSSLNCNDKDLPIKRIREDVEKKVIADKDIADVCFLLDTKKYAVTIRGLINIFKMLHYRALCIIDEIMENKGIIKHIPWLRRALENKFNVPKYKSLSAELLSWLNSGQKEIENLMKYNLGYNELMSLGLNDNEFLNEKDEKKKNYFETMITALNFSELYVPQMMKFGFMDSYTCSFAKYYDSSAMWANYADNHKGIVLMYNYADDMCDIELEKMPISKAENNVTEIRKLNFSQVEYSDAIPKFNWFYVLGKLFGDERKHWLIDNEKESLILEKMRMDGQKYLDSLLNIDKGRMLHKSKCWQYEYEYRCFQSYSITEFYGENEIGQKYKYDFADLYGIIFGIRTSYEYKIRIIDIVREKCKKYNRDKFDFYQAYLDYDSGKIKKQKLDIGLFQ